MNLACSLPLAAHVFAATLAVAVTQDAPARQPPRLRDAVFRCCWIDSPPYNHRTSHPIYGVDGANMEMFRLLKQRTGFTCESFTEFRSAHSTGWDDYIVELARCAGADGLVRNNSGCQCDISSASFFHSSERSIVDFLPANLLSRSMILTHRRETKTTTNAWLFVNTFRPLVWVFLAFLLVVFVALKMIDPGFAPGGQPFPTAVEWKKRRLSALSFTVLKARPFYRARKAVQTSLLAMIGTTDARENRILHHWALQYTICLCGLIFVLIYEAAMTTILVQEKVVAEFTTYNVLLECSFNISNICVATGDFMDSEWSQLLAEREKKKCPRYQRNNGNSSRFTNYEELYRAVDNGSCKYAMIDSGFALAQQTGRYCGKLVTVGEHWGGSSAGMVAPKNWPYFEEARAATLEIIESGAIADSIEAFIARNEQCSIPTNPTLTFDRLKTFFIVVGVVWLLLFLFMIFVPQRRKQRDPVESAILYGP